jgi:RHS repeat-associated protein
LDYQVNFSYKSSIKVEGEASWIGLGWTFDPGSITRDVMGHLPGIRDTDGVLVHGPDYNRIPMEQGDRYFVTIPGHGTHEMTRSNLPNFNTVNEANPYPNDFLAPFNGSNFHFIEYRPYKIYTSSESVIARKDDKVATDEPDITEFILTTDDGTRYIYKLPTTATHIDLSGNNSKRFYFSAWRLIAILDPLCPQISELDEISHTTLATGPGNWIFFDYDYYPSINPANYPDRYYLSEIVTPTHKARFITGPREDWTNNYTLWKLLTGDEVIDNARKLIRIELYNTVSEESFLKAIELQQSYELAKLKDGVGGTQYGEGKLSLNGIIFRDRNNSPLPGYIFEYDNSDIYFGNAFYDGYGYYNIARVNAHSGTLEDLSHGGTGDNWGPNQDPDPNNYDGAAWSMTKIVYPTGGYEEFYYTNDFISMPEIPIEVYGRSDIDRFSFVFAGQENGDQGIGGGGHLDSRLIGGARITKILRKEGEEIAISERLFTYTHGKVNCPPYKMLPFLSLPSFYLTEYKTNHRGKIGVVYEKIEETINNKIRITKEYEADEFFTMQTVMDLSRPQAAFFAYENNNLWGKLVCESTQPINANVGIFQSTKYTFIANKREMAFGINRDFPGTYHVIQYMPDLVSQTIDKKYTSDETASNLRTHVEIEYHPRTYQVLSRKTTTNNKITEIFTQYAHDAYSSNGDVTWVHNEELTGPRQMNQLNLVAMEHAESQIRTQAGWQPVKVYAADVSTYSSKDVIIPPVKRDEEMPSAWLLDRIYTLNMVNFSSQVPLFSEWDEDDGQNSPWLLQNEILEYDDYGQAIEYVDLDNNRVKLFYGINSSPFSQNTGYKNAHLTGMKLINGANEYAYEINYDTDVFLPNVVFDENDNSTSFTYDNALRLENVYNDLSQSGNTLLKSMSYYLARDPISEDNNYDALAPNYISETVYDEGFESTVKTFFNGIGLNIQQITKPYVHSNDDNIYSSTDYDYLNRPIKSYKNYNRNSEEYDPEYGHRNPDGTLIDDSLPGYPHYYQTTTYLGATQQSERSTFPGIDGERATIHSTWEQLKGDYYDLGTVDNTIHYTAIRSYDEIGNETINVFNTVDQLVFESTVDQQQISAPLSLATVNADAAWDFPFSDDDEAAFVVEVETEVFWQCDSDIEGGRADTYFKIYSEDNPLFPIVDRSSNSGSGSFMAQPGTVYRVYASANVRPREYERITATMNGNVWKNRMITSEQLLATTQYFYDEAGNITRVLHPNYFNPPAGSRAEDWISTFKYDTRGLLLQTETPDEGRTQMIYDHMGRLRFSQNAKQRLAGKVAFFQYDFAGRIIKTGVGVADFSALNGDGESPALEENTENTLTLSVFDTTPLAGDFADDLYATMNQYWRVDDGEKEAFEILLASDFTFSNAINQMTATATLSANKWEVEIYAYDGENRLRDKRLLVQGIDRGRDTEWTVSDIRYVYGRQNQLLERYVKTEDHSFTHFFEYNGLLQLENVYTSADGRRPANYDVSYLYNQQGLVDTLNYRTQAGNHMIPYDYNMRDWITQIGVIGDNNQPFWASYDYEANSNITMSEYFSKASLTESRFKYSYGYDIQNRIRTANYAWHNGSSWISESAYGLNNLEYDDMGNILSLNRHGEDNSLVDELSYRYNRNNQLLEVEDASGSSLSWDAKSAVYSYDANGSMINVYYPEHEFFRFLELDEANLPVRTYKAYGTYPHTQIESKGWHNSEDQGAIRITLTDGTSHVYTKANAGRGLCVFEISADGSTILSGPVVFDMYDNGSSSQEGTALATHLDDIPRDGRIVLIGLIDSGTDNSQSEWTEAAFTAVEKLGGLRIRQLQNRDSYAFAVKTDRAFTAMERLDVYTGETPSPEYDCSIRMPRELYAMAEYRYNSAGQRILKRGSPGTSGQYYIMDGTLNLGVVDEDAVLKHWNIFGRSTIGRYERKSLYEPQIHDDDLYLLKSSGKESGKVDKKESSIQKTSAQAKEEKTFAKPKVVYKKYFYIKDHLGSTRAVLDPDKEIVEANNFYPFGLQMPGKHYVSSYPQTKEGFTGKEKDSDTNWMYFGARYYDPALGKFLSVDPHAGSYPSLSSYHYVGNNPLNYVDPTGMDTTSAMEYDLEETVVWGDRWTDADERKYQRSMGSSDNLSRNGIDDGVEYLGYGITFWGYSSAANEHLYRSSYMRMKNYYNNLIQSNYIKGAKSRIYLKIPLKRLMEMEVLMKNLKFATKTVFGAGIVLGAARSYRGFQQGNIGGGVAGMFDMAVAFVAISGPVGMGVAIVYYTIDYTIGVDNIVNYIINNRGSIIRDINSQYTAPGNRWR